MNYEIGFTVGRTITISLAQDMARVIGLGRLRSAMAISATPEPHVSLASGIYGSPIKNVMMIMDGEVSTSQCADLKAGTITLTMDADGKISTSQSTELKSRTITLILDNPDSIKPILEIIKTIGSIDPDMVGTLDPAPLPDKIQTDNTNSNGGV